MIPSIEEPEAEPTKLGNGYANGDVMPRKISSGSKKFQFIKKN